MTSCGILSKWALPRVPARGYACPIDLLALGLRDEVTNWEQREVEGLQCRCQRMDGWTGFMWILDGAA